MTKEDVLMLLKSRVLVSKAFKDNVKTLVKTLEYIPLAITHIVAYLIV
jgi:hypothetical protein